MSFLLDTCVLSEFTKNQPNQSLLRWMGSHQDSSFFISVITLGELKKGIERLEKTKKRAMLENWFENDLRQRFASQTIPIDETVARVWGKMLADNLKKGITLPTLDSLLAASAKAFGLTLVTRNLNDFIYTEVELLNPWK